MRSIKRLILPSAAALFGLAAGLTIAGRSTLPISNADPLPRSVNFAPAAEVPNPANPGVVTIPDAELSGYKHVLAISDVHGQFAEAWHLLLADGIIAMTPAPETKDGTATGHQRWHAAWHGSDTLLIVTGDSIDKGPQSLETLKLWYDLQHDAKNNNKIIVLLGNHEAEYLADPVAKKALRLQEELIGQGFSADALARPDFTTHDGYPLGKFIRSMPLAACAGKWLFCHAGWIPAPSAIDPKQTTPAGKWNAFVSIAKTALQNGHYATLVTKGGDESDPAEPDSGESLSQILEKKSDAKGKKWWKKETPVLEARLAEYGLYGVVFGHQPKAFDTEDAIARPAPDDFHLVKIDTGMAVPGAPKDSNNDAEETWPQPHLGYILQFPNPAQLTSGTAPPAMNTLGFSRAIVTGDVRTPAPR